MSTALLAAGWVTGILASTSPYLASQHQKVLRRPLPQRVAMPTTVIGAAVSVGLLGQAVSPATAIYTLVVIAMTSWTLGPLAIAAWRRRSS